MQRGESLCIDHMIPTPQQAGGSANQFELYDDDGRLRRTGTVWTTSAHIITAIIGSGVLSLAWAIAQLGWIAGPIAMILFSFVSYYTAVMLAECYRTGDPTSGKRNYTYMDSVRSILGGSSVQICGIIQYVNLFGITVGYTTAASISMMAIKRSNCFHNSGGKNPCHMSSNPYMIMFGLVEILLSQIPDFDQIWWLSIVAAIMSFTYSSVGLGLGIAKVIAIGEFRGTTTGVSAVSLGQTQKIWRSFQAFGDIAFAYSFSFVLIEIQDTIRAPPSEAKTMKKASLISLATTTVFYTLCGCLGYAGFGDNAPTNLLTGFGFYNPFWLLDIANAAIVIHLVGAYQLFTQQIFAFLEKWAAKTWPDSRLISKEFRVALPGMRRRPYNLSIFKLVWRSMFVVLVTVTAMLVPFFNDIVGFLGAIGFWPLSIHFPVQMYVAQKKIPRWSPRWVCLQLLSAVCFVVSVLAATGSVAGVFLDLKAYKPFHMNY